MPDSFNLEAIADAADAIYSGYAFTTENDIVRIVNLYPPHHALVIRPNGEVLETSMSDIELQLVLGYYARVSDYLVA